MSSFLFLLMAPFDTCFQGRTGRAGRTGHVIAIVAENEAPLITAWETMLRIKWEQYEKD